MQPAAEVPKHRETPMTQPEARYYKETFRTTKNIAQVNLSGHNPIYHEAPAPSEVPRSDAKLTARMMKSNVQMYPKQVDADTFVTPAKRSNAAQN